MEKIIKDACEIARKQFVYMSYGEWDGSPSSIDDFDIGKLMELQYLIGLIISNKHKKEIEN